ncbi:MAG: hypothetical protein KGJ57_04750 [Sphingomonadales bacterium]|nr:hypothetical protein [Sphingomonadales bacterium]MDE2168724.1 hypothetical protein [Sphingomonadales bacterium]
MKQNSYTHSGKTILPDGEISDDLRFRFQFCGIACRFPSTRGFYGCGALACRRCNRRLQKRFYQEAMGLFAHHPASMLRIIDVQIGRIILLEALGGVIRRFKNNLRCLVARFRRARAAGSRIEIFGMCDIVALPDGGWDVVAKMIFHFPSGGGEAALVLMLQKKWRGTRVRPAGPITNEIISMWPTLAGGIDLLDTINGLRNCQILRVHVRPRRSGANEAAISRHDEWRDSPMPFIF